MQKNLGLRANPGYFLLWPTPESPGFRGPCINPRIRMAAQSIRIRNEKMLEEAVRETIRARGSQDIETAKAGRFFGRGMLWLWSNPGVFF